MTSDDTSKFLQIQSSYKARSARTALQTFMVHNHDRFCAMFGTDRIDWISLTAALTEMGFCNSKGGELRAEPVRQTWLRAKRIHEKRSSK